MAQLRLTRNSKDGVLSPLTCSCSSSALPEVGGRTVPPRLPPEGGAASWSAMTRWPLPVPMRRALELARAAAAAGEVPVGAVVVRGGAIIAEAHNMPRTLGDPTAHAEMLAIRRAAEVLGTERLEGCELFVTLEPCTMCAGAIIHARPARVIYGAGDAKGGAVEHGPRLFDRPGCLHRPEVVGGVGEGEAAELLRKFFRERR